MSLESEAEIAMNMVFNRFKRDDLVSFYKSASEVVVTNDAQWNSDFDNPRVSNIVKTSQKRDIECRIIWSPQPELVRHIDGEENINVKAAIPIGLVLIQVKSPDFNWLSDAKSFFIKGNRYVKFSDWEGVGMLGTINRYQITLVKDE